MMIETSKTVKEILCPWPHQVLEADVGTEGGAKRLADAIAAKFGTIDYAVSAFGGWWQKGVSGTTAD